MSEKAEAILAGIGGKGNVKDIEACITRIRVEVADPAQVNEAASGPTTTCTTES